MKYLDVSLTVEVCSSGAVFGSTVECVLKVRRLYSLKLKCFIAQGWTKVWLYVERHEYIEERRERTGTINLFSTEKSLQARSGCAVHLSNKNKYEQLENDEKSVSGIMSGKLP